MNIETTKILMERDENGSPLWERMARRDTARVELAALARAERAFGHVPDEDEVAALVKIADLGEEGDVGGITDADYRASFTARFGGVAA